MSVPPTQSFIIMEKAYDHLTIEKDINARWQKEKTYTPSSGPAFTIDTPPPTVSGSLHIGHVFSYTQTDIIARYKRLKGFAVVYPFGSDDNGLATERYVEKKLNIRGQDMARSAFIEHCLTESRAAAQLFIDLWQRMGLSMDWDNVYSTISARARRISQESFIDLYNKGYVYRKQDPALYCPTCRTAVAQAELDDTQVATYFNDIVFKDAQGGELIVGTTRPEMLPACVALLYHPNDDRYKKLKGTFVQVPLFDITVPVIADEQVDIEKGTGLVMCCTFGDKTDIAWYKKHNLPYKRIIADDGTFVAETGFLAGLTVLQARTKVIQELTLRELLRGQRPITHAVNVHERCKKEIEFVVLNQWFINILSYKKELQACADQIAWYPAYMTARYIDWVEHLNWDWCISRQRFYGIPFPVWHCQDCTATVLADVKDLPVDPQETACPKPCPQCGSTRLKPDTDVMDTWNTSSLTPYIVFDIMHHTEAKSVFTDPKIKDFLPMSMRPQAHDIIRTWAFYTIAKAWMHHGTIPWKNIVISGHVLSDAKQKISKSKGGADVTPEGLLAKYPADAIRFWTASGSLGQDIAFSEAQIQIGQKLITKLWNAFRFINEHNTQCPAEQVPQELGCSNEWLLHTATECFATYTNYLEQNEFGLALDVLEKFFWKTFCDNYLELVKDQLFNPGSYTAQEVCATRWTLYYVGLRILQMYAPYMPYITEQLYQEMYRPAIGTASIHQTTFEHIQQPFVFNQSAQTARILMTVVGAVRRLKTEKQLSLKTPLQELTIISDSVDVSYRLQALEQVIKGITKAQAIVYTVNPQGTQAIQEKDGLWSATVSCIE